APDIKSWNRKIKISGDARGTVNDLKLEDLVVQAGGSTYFAGNASMFGLPDIELTFIDLKADEFRTTYSDALTYIPELRRVSQPAISKLQFIKFKGSFTGFIRDFVTFGTIETALGTISSDLNMKLPRGSSPVYSGSVATNNFQLGTFLQNNVLGNIAFEGDVKGRGFNMKTLMVDIDGNINHFEFNDYRYRNITTNGTLNKQLFDGFFQI